MKTNYHTHTTRCHHARGEDREYIESAIAYGLTELGFSDHSPYVFGDGHVSSFRMLPEAYTEYFDSLNALREEYADRIRMYIGVEMEYYKDDFEATMSLLRSRPIDYLILGQHFVDSEPGKLYNGGASPDEERLRLYVDRVIEAMEKGVYSYVAHPDIIRFTGDEGLFRNEIRRLCRASLATETPLEINLFGIRELRHYPNPIFWEEAGALGCHVIFGSDAHSPHTVLDAKSAEVAEEMVKKYGLIKEESLRLKW